ncbi:(S)-coclaurine N-methyltransferase, partial [Thalictrum thalictroides]
PLDEDDWFAEYVFPAGTMITPSASFFLYFQDDVSVVNHWTLSGKHFSRTHEEWLKRLDTNVEVIKPMFVTLTGNKEEAMKLVNFWRGLCLLGMEMFGYNNGEEWMASHVLFKKK